VYNKKSLKFFLIKQRLMSKCLQTFMHFNMIKFLLSYKKLLLNNCSFVADFDLLYLSLTISFTENKFIIRARNLEK